MYSDDVLLTCAVIRVEFAKPTPTPTYNRLFGVANEAKFDSRTYIVKPSEAFQIINAIKKYLESINYPHINAYIGGYKAEKESYILSEEYILDSLSKDPHIIKHIEKTKAYEENEQSNSFGK